MSDDNVAADPYDGKTNDELKEELRAMGRKVGGNRDELISRLEERDDQDDAEDALDAEDTKPTSEEEANATGNPEASGKNHLPQQADLSPAATSSRAGIITESLGPDGRPLPQRHPEPADVAGPGGPGEGTSDNDPDNRARAFAAREAADVRIREGDGSKEHLAMRDVDASPANPDFDEHDFPEGGFDAHSLPVADRREKALSDWVDANPQATVIPPTLLPPAYQDPTIATPGLPGDRA